MGDKETATRRRQSMDFWQRLNRGPWPKSVIARLTSGLDLLVQRLRSHPDVSAVILFGSYARGEFGRKSDVDLLIVLDLDDVDLPPESTAPGRAALRLVSEVEAEARLPMHLAPLLASADRLAALGAALLHEIWADGIVLHARAGVLAQLQPDRLAPWTVVRFSVARAAPHVRVRLSRRLHGVGDRPGLIHPPALTLGRGALLVPADQQQSVREALDDVGATYDLIPVWRET